MFKITLQKPDTIGALASTLCLIHCLLTPLLFLSHHSITDHHHTAPVWWKSLDFLFLGISFIAVYRSTQTSSKPMMKYFLWSSWILLASLIFNEKMGVFEIPEYVMTISAITLAVLHIYNLKYCQCDDERCCNN